MYTRYTGGRFSILIVALLYCYVFFFVYLDYIWIAYSKFKALLQYGHSLSKLAILMEVATLDNGER